MNSHFTWSAWKQAGVGKTNKCPINRNIYKAKMIIAINILNEQTKKWTINFEKTKKLYVNGEIWL